MDTNANLDGILGITSDDIKNEEPVQKERKKPGPKPKAEKNDEVTNAKEPEVKIEAATAAPKTAEIEDKTKQNDLSNTENEKNRTLIAKPNIWCEFKNPVTLFRGPSSHLPLCNVYFVKLSGRIVREYAECLATIPEIGRIYGYVYADTKIRKLLSTIH